MTETQRLDPDPERSPESEQKEASEPRLTAATPLFHSLHDQMGYKSLLALYLQGLWAARVPDSVMEVAATIACGIGKGTVCTALRGILHGSEPGCLTVPSSVLLRMCPSPEILFIGSLETSPS